MRSKKPKSMTAKQLIAFRTKNKMRQKDLSDLLGVTWQCIYNWELENRGIPETTARILRLLTKYPQLIEEME